MYDILTFTIVRCQCVPRIVKLLPTQIDRLLARVTANESDNGYKGDKSNTTDANTAVRVFVSARMITLITD